jgi:cytochrome c oxidase subunit I+III
MRGMVRRVYAYPPELGFEWLNLISSAGAFVLAGGIAIVLWDVIRPKRNQPVSERNPWGAGTLEWVAEMPNESWGIRSIPEIDSRYPLWEQPDFVRNVDEGRFFLPDAEEGSRETLVTTAVDARPVQCLRILGPSFVPFSAAVFTGGIFIFSTFYMWWWAIGSAVLTIGALLVWFWTGTALIPEKPEKDVGLGLRLPIYVSGPSSVGWWAMFITMLGDMTAFVSLVFGYFFYWTSRPDFLNEASGPGVTWPLVALGAGTAAWALTLAARYYNKRSAPAFYALLSAATLLAGCAAVAILAGPYLTGMNPARHVYPAIVWVLVIWTAAHLGLGMLMQLYCVARRLAGRMTAVHDIDIQNVALYWHFMAVTVGITVAVIAGFPHAL